jgi:hypothetical protein
MSGFSEDTFRNTGFDPVYLYYAIEDPKSGDVISGSTSCHVCSVNLLPPGRSLNFAVGVSEVSDKNRMRVAYTFDWEKEDSYNGSNSTHSVEYYFSLLPESILSPAGTQIQ